jgi:fructokinase
MDSLVLPHYTIHRPAAYDFPALSPADFDALLNPAPDWIYFGTLQQMSAPAYDFTLKLLGAAPSAKRFYDINLRTNSFTPELVRTLAGHANVLKLNEHEVPVFRDIAVIRGESGEKFCRECLNAFQLDAICITLGSQGCALLMDNEYLEAPGFPLKLPIPLEPGTLFLLLLSTESMPAGFRRESPVSRIVSALSLPAA